MEFYIDNRSLAFVKRAYRRVTENTKATVYRAVLFNKGPFFKTAAFRFFRKKGVSDIEYVVFCTAPIRRAIALLNGKVKRITLTVIIDRPLTERDKALFSRARS
jgi:hypothetical protein